MKSKNEINKTSFGVIIAAVFALLFVVSLLLMNNYADKKAAKSYETGFVDGYTKGTQDCYNSLDSIK